MFEIAYTPGDAVSQTRLLAGAVRRLSDEPFGSINDVHGHRDFGGAAVVALPSSVQQRTGSGHLRRVRDVRACPDGASPHHEHELSAQMAPLAQFVRCRSLGEFEQLDLRHAHGASIPE